MVSPLLKIEVGLQLLFQTLGNENSIQYLIYHFIENVI